MYLKLESAPEALAVGAGTPEVSGQSGLSDSAPNPASGEEPADEPQLLCSLYNCGDRAEF